MKKLLFLGACLVALASSPVMAQTGGPEVVAVRVTEFQRKILFSIARGQQPEEFTVELGKEGKASVNYQTVLAKLYAQGYVLQAVVPGLNNGNGYVESSLIFTKPTSKS